MFSFVDDTVLDPFLGSGTTTLAAAKVGRNSIGIEVDEAYAEQARSRVEKAIGMFDRETIYLNYAKIPHEQTVAA